MNLGNNPPPDDVVKRRGEDEVLALVQQSSSTKPFNFHAFHVGQGMCSLVDNGKIGFLLDAGAGTPVTRRIYKTPGMRNDLLTRINKLEHLIFILSHPDSDHWRLLSWDLGLLSQVDLALVPSGVPLVAFFDSSIKRKVRAIDYLLLDLGSGQLLEILRSKPATRDRNGDGLVCVFTGRNGSRILAPGDYVYQRFLSDHNPSISGLFARAFSGLQVPHHGDEESAFSVPSPAAAGSKAFFSAGDHKGYGHPTINSQTAHHAFSNVTNTTLAEIKAMPLS